MNNFSDFLEGRVSLSLIAYCIVHKRYIQDNEVEGSHIVVRCRVIWTNLYRVQLVMEVFVIV
jgi:hypothetical protein